MRASRRNFLQRLLRRVLLGVVPLLSACYTYATIDPVAARPGDGVRARISQQAAARLAPLLGTGESRVLAGKLVENHDGDLIVEVPAVVEVGVGSSIQSLYQRVSLARGEVIELEARRLDRFRTGAVAAAAAVVVTGAVIKAAAGGRGKEAIPGGGGTDTRIPVP
jgi:hypothetical protein